MSNFRLGDSLIRIKNGYMGRKSSVKILNSKLVRSVLAELKNQGYILDFQNDNSLEINVDLRYGKNRVPALNSMKLISKPGCRRYLRYQDIRNSKDIFGIQILSTNLGILTTKKAKELKVGGELLGEFF